MRQLVPLQDALSPLLRPPGRLYAALMRLRRRAYAGGALRAHRAPWLTVSVGNICWGGTGKTPLTDWIVDWALKAGRRPAVLTRGYKASPPQLPYLVGADATPREAGDEPLLLARAHPGARVVVDPRRPRAALALAQAPDPPDMLVLDDGFQHLAMARDIDLVLLRPADLVADWDRVLPAGPWREGHTALEAAHALLIKCPPDEFRALAPLIRRHLEPLRKPVFNFSLAVRGLVRLDGGGTARGFGGEPYLLVTGVGEPDQVAATARALLGAPPAHHLRYDDHHAYTPADRDFIDAEARRRGAAHVLCTAKDAVKLAGAGAIPLWTFDTTLAFGEALFTDLAFPQWWEAAVARA